ncbi:MAG: enoyl-CoA hydratase/isomerase family protein [Corticimicrobacter sp.]|uniref:enoyl-CoA hydratase/isomerase family protein n=1 Tax=Corticimicrobacter sp. TaxID=2678536 RepID=UPI0032DBD135
MKQGNSDAMSTASPSTASPSTASPGTAQPAVLFEERQAGSGRIGIATLNAPRTLNGLTLGMVDLLYPRLRQWEDDPDIVAIVLAGAGDRAFCAGGDLHGLYRDMLENGSAAPQDLVYARTFFEREYRLDHAIHHLRTPVLVWGQGFVMGGGIGLMAGASHRIVLPNSRLAMPEISIGLFPDVGGTWLLARVPMHGGRFLALTGAQLQAEDAIFAGLADYLLPEGGWTALMNALETTDWPKDVVARHECLHVLLAGLQQPECGPMGPFQTHIRLIHACCAHAELDATWTALAALATHPDPWLARAAQTMLAGAPGSARLAWTLMQHGHGRSLGEILRMELDAALHCCAEGDLQEGIRALLIDKDRMPRWSPATLADVDMAWGEARIRLDWPGAHPLADLA